MLGLQDKAPVHGKTACRRARRYHRTVEPGGSNRSSGRASNLHLQSHNWNIWSGCAPTGRTGAGATRAPGNETCQPQADSVPRRLTRRAACAGRTSVSEAVRQGRDDALVRWLSQEEAV